jgi:hypothetical protein
MPNRMRGRNKASWNEERATGMILGNGEWISPADLPGRQIDGGEFNFEDNLTQAVELLRKKPTSSVPWVRSAGIKCALPS